MWAEFNTTEIALNSSHFFVKSPLVCHYIVIPVNLKIKQLHTVACCLLDFFTTLVFLPSTFMTPMINVPSRLFKCSSIYVMI